MHYSTDYVFDGEGNRPYKETDTPNPVSVYGRSKLAGEQAIQTSGCDYLIFRTSWVYASRGNNFLLTILKLAEEREELRVIADQIGSPTSARLIAETTFLCVIKASKSRQSGSFVSDTYHLTASNSTSWYGFSEKIINFANKKLNKQLKTRSIKAIPTTEYPTPAKRPANSQLSLENLEKAFCVKMPDWEIALELCLEEIS